MAKHLLSPSKVARTNKEGRYADGGGLYLYVKSESSKSWVYRWSFTDETGKVKQKYVGLGSAFDVSLEAARKMAEERRAAKVQGAPVLSTRDAVAIEKAKEAIDNRTLKDAVDEWIAERSLELKNEHHKATLTTHMAKWVYPLVGDKPLREVTKHDIANVIRPIVPLAPEIARKTQQRLSNTFIREIAHDRFTAANPAEKKLLTAMGVFSGLKDRGKFAALPFDDVPRLYSTMKARKTLGALCLRFLILTCVRSKEIRNACWSEIDFEKRLWVIPAERMKMDREHRVPLTDEALRVLQEAGKYKLAKSDLVFPSVGRSKAESVKIVPMTDMSLLNQVTRLIDCNTTVHGLRSSFRDWAAEKTDHANHVAEMALAHIVHGVEGAYRRGDLLEKRRALMEDWSAFVTTKAKPFEQVKRVKKKKEGATKKAA